MSVAIFSERAAEKALKILNLEASRVPRDGVSLTIKSNAPAMVTVKLLLSNDELIAITEAITGRPK